MILPLLISAMPLACKPDTRGEVDVQALVRQLDAGFKVDVRLAAIGRLERLAGRGAAAVPALVVALADEDWRIGQAAARALAAVGVPALDRLVAALADERGHVRKYAAEALGRAGRVALGPLAEALAHPRWVARDAAASAVVAIGQPALPMLERLAHDSDWRVREGVALALGKRRTLDARWRGLLRRAALDDRDNRVRETAIVALARGDEKIDLFRRVLRDKPPRLRIVTARLIGAMRRDKASPALPELVQLLDDAESEVRRAAVKALGKIGRPHSRGRDAVSPLAARLSDGDAGVRKAAAHALGALGARARPAIAALRRALDDAVPRVRRAARRSIERITREGS